MKRKINNRNRQPPLKIRWSPIELMWSRDGNPLFKKFLLWKWRLSRVECKAVIRRQSSLKRHKQRRLQRILKIPIWPTFTLDEKPNKRNKSKRSAMQKFSPNMKSTSSKKSRDLHLLKLINKLLRLLLQQLALSKMRSSKAIRRWLWHQTISRVLRPFSSASY